VGVLHAQGRGLPGRLPGGMAPPFPGVPRAHGAGGGWLNSATGGTDGLAWAVLVRRKGKTTTPTRQMAEEERLALQTLLQQGD